MTTTRKPKTKATSFGGTERKYRISEMAKVREFAEQASARACQGLVGMIADMRDALINIKPFTRAQKAMAAWLEKYPERFMAKLEELEREQAAKDKQATPEIARDFGAERLEEVIQEVLARFQP